MLSFRVSDLGRIAEAEYTAAPLTLLIGRNNTGKSYLATLIWLMSRLDIILSFAERPSYRPAWFRSLLDQETTSGHSRQALGLAEAKENIQLLQSIFDSFTPALLARVFAFEGFRETQVELRVAESFRPLEISLTHSEGTPEAVDEKSRARSTAVISYEIPGFGTRRTRYVTRNRQLSSFAIERVFVDGIGLSLFGPEWFKYRNSCYIPAARTGLMMALRPLIARNFEVDEQQPAAQIPAAINDFLRRVVDDLIDPSDAPVADWLEQTVLRGNVTVSNENNVPEYDYTPINTGLKVPIRATSSMITELAPFIHLMRSSYSEHFIFEEPEAHLHLSAQRGIARAIARLINQGAHFTITTHSDTFIQQINNLMHLHDHPNRADQLAKLDYEENDLINPSNCLAYEFRDEGDRTRIVPLARTDSGFAVPSLNETIISLADETIALQETDNEG